MSRILEWGVHVLVFIIVALSCFAVAEISLRDYLYYFGITCLHYMCVLQFCYLLNDWTDREEDTQQGKRKCSREFSGRQIAAILMGLLVVGAGSILYVHPSLLTIVFVAIQFIVTAIYSLKPIRLKERGLVGIFAAAIIQRVPAFIIFALLISLNAVVGTYISIWLSLLGLIFILEHQMEDWYRDKNSGVMTYLVTIGIKTGNRVRSWVYVGFVMWSMVPLLSYLIDLAEPLKNINFLVAMIMNAILAVTLFRIRYRHTRYLARQNG